MPRPCVLCKGGTRYCLYDVVCHAEGAASHLRRPSPALYHLLLLSPITFLRTTRSRDRFLTILEQTRQRYHFVVVGYVVMPEHIPLLITETEIGNPSTVMQVLKQRTARALLPKKRESDPRQRFLFGEDLPRIPFWQARFYDFNVWTTKKRVEKLRYMHRNPVKRGTRELARRMALEQLPFLLPRRSRPVRVNEGWGKISFSSACGVTCPSDCTPPWFPPFANYANDGAPHFVGAASEIKGWATR